MEQSKADVVIYTPLQTRRSREVGSPSLEDPRSTACCGVQPGQDRLVLPVATAVDRTVKQLDSTALWSTGTQGGPGRTHRQLRWKHCAGPVGAKGAALLDGKGRVPSEGCEN